ncbi:hypothetical protein quinque_002757 [Culex quinquefasciatus]
MYSNDDYAEGGYEEYGYEMAADDGYDRVIKGGVVYEIQNLYENTFPKLSEQHFEKKAWPSEDEVAHLVDNDNLFMILYKELYYRHLHARIQGGPSLEQRLNSFYNYCNFFNYILPSKEPVQLELPDIWLWELIDEFVYQFQNFAQYRARLTDKSDEEMDMLLNNNSKVWNILCILNVLHSLVSMSKIKDQLEAAAAGRDPEEVAGEFGRHSFYKMLGYFSLVDCCVCIRCSEITTRPSRCWNRSSCTKKSQYSHIPACQISTSYYVGFAYMMMRRYSDAIRTFSSILLYIQRTKQLYSARSYQNDQINKQTDQMYHLLAICLVLHPQCIDESIQQVLREKNYHDNMYKMQCGDLDTFRNFFVFACPKFVSPVPPPSDAPLMTT